MINSRETAGYWKTFIAETWRTVISDQFSLSGLGVMGMFHGPPWSVIQLNSSRWRSPLIARLLLLLALQFLCSSKKDVISLFAPVGMDLLSGRWLACSHRCRTDAWHLQSLLCPEGYTSKLHHRVNAHGVAINHSSHSNIVDKFIWILFFSFFFLYLPHGCFPKDLWLHKSKQVYLLIIPWLQLRLLVVLCLL